MENRPIWVKICCFLIANLIFLPNFVSADCNEKLAKRPTKLSTGVLAETEDGRLILGRTSFTGSLHGFIVEHLKSYGIKQILWMGEARYYRVGDRIFIVEANETSGHYLELLKKPLQVDGKIIPVSNSVHAIPKYLQAPGFMPIEFNDERKHLVDEHGHLLPNDDVRHSIGNALAVINGVLRNIKQYPTESSMLIDLARKSTARPVPVLRYVLWDMIAEDRITKSDYIHLLEFLDAIDNPNAVIEFKDPQRVELIAQELRLIEQHLGANKGLSISVIQVPN